MNFINKIINLIKMAISQQVFYVYKLKDYVNTNWSINIKLKSFIFFSKQKTNNKKMGNKIISLIKNISFFVINLSNIIYNKFKLFIFFMFIGLKNYLLFYFIKITNITYKQLIKFFIYLFICNLILYLVYDLNFLYLNITVPSGIVSLFFNIYFVLCYFKTKTQNIQFFIYKIIFFIIFLYFDIFTSHVFVYSKSFWSVFVDTEFGKILFSGVNVLSGYLGVGFLTAFFYYLSNRGKDMSDEFDKADELNRKAELEEQERRFSELELEKINAVDALEEIKKELNKIKKEKIAMVQSKKQLQDNFETLQLENEAMVKYRKTQEASGTYYGNEIKDTLLYKNLEEKYKALFAKYKLLYGHCIKFDTTNKTLTENCKTLDTNYKALTENYQTLDIQYKTLTENYQKICEDNNMLNNLRNKLIADNQENAQAIVDIEKLRVEIAQYKAQKQVFEDSIKELQEELDGVRKEYLNLTLESNYSTSNIEPIFKNIFDNFNKLNKLNKHQFNYKYKNFELKSDENFNYSIFNNILNSLNSVMSQVSLPIDFYSSNINILNMFFDENININVNSELPKISKEEFLIKDLVKLESEVANLVNDYESKLPVEIIVEQEEKNEDRIFEVPQIQQFPMETLIEQEQVKVEINTELLQEVKTEAEVPVLEQKENEEINNLVEYPSIESNPFFALIDSDSDSDSDSGIIPNVNIEESNLNIDKEEGNIMNLDLLLEQNNEIEKPKIKYQDPFKEDFES